MRAAENRGSHCSGGAQQSVARKARSGSPGFDMAFPRNAFLDVPITIGHPRRANSGSRARISKFCSCFFPNPMPGSSRSCDFARPTRLARTIASRSPAITSRITSRAKRASLHRAGSSAHVHQDHGHARAARNFSETRIRAAGRKRRSGFRRRQPSPLRRPRPSACPPKSECGACRASLRLRAGCGEAPLPRKLELPLAAWIRRRCRAGPRHRVRVPERERWPLANPDTLPPSEKLSGVIFSTPITSVRSPRSSVRDGRCRRNCLRWNTVHNHTEHGSRRKRRKFPCAAAHVTLELGEAS